jgi:hypothetical protein
LICGGVMPPPVRLNNWKRFCGRRCAGKHAANMLLRKATTAQRQQWGREGAAVVRAQQRGLLLEKLGHLSREDAIWQAWKMGRHANKGYRLRTAKRQQAIRDVA